MLPQTAEIDVAADPDSADSSAAADPDKALPPPEEEPAKKERPETKGVLRDYIESFDKQTLADTARCGTANFTDLRPQLARAACSRVQSKQWRGGNQAQLHNAAFRC